MPTLNVIIQGYHGAFHEEAALKYFGDKSHQIVPADTFTIQARKLRQSPNDHLAIMAIENTIAGSILQNYRILRENNFRIIGEVYLRIRHNLMCLDGQILEDIKEVRSHPMALNQCLKYLRHLEGVKLVETDDTALSAKLISENKIKGVAAIASTVAANIYNLEILSKNIETSKKNFTRFFIIQDSTSPLKQEKYCDKASIYLRVSHEPGSLLQVLQLIHDHGINMSKLQSFPVLNEMSQYYFHIDLEFDSIEIYRKLIQSLDDVTLMLEILGVYPKSSYYAD